MDSRLIHLEQLRSGMEEAEEYTRILMSRVGKAAAEAIEEVHEVKVDKGNAVAVVITTEVAESDDAEIGWKRDETADYPYYYDIAAAVTEKDRADIIIAPESMGTAVSCGLCPTSETLTGKIRVRSASLPASGITAEYWIEPGKE